MPAQEREFLALPVGMPPPAASTGVGGPGRSVPPSNGPRNVLSSAAARVTSTSGSDNNIGNVDPSHPDVVSPNTPAPSSLSGEHRSASQRLSAASLQKQVDSHSSPSQTLLSHSSKMAGSNGDKSSSSSMLVDQVGKHSTLGGGHGHSNAAELHASSDEASSSETDDCSQTSSNSSESSNESSEEGGVPPQPAQQAAAANKIDPATLLLPSVETLADTSTLILFDWDDTLLASTHLANSNYRLDEPDVLPETVMQQLSLLEDAVIDMLDLAATLGTVCIITNAETGWVELSCKKFLPRVMAHVEGLPVVSARSTYEPKHPALPSKWKLEAFSHRISQLCDETSPSKAKNVISLGDSHAEREAVRTVTRDMPCTLTKSVKFVERPTLEQLLRELQLMVRCFPMICYTQRDLDLALTVEALQVAA